MRIKSIISGLPVAMVALVLGCATSRQPIAAGEQTVEVVYEVLGMDCPGCHGGLEKNLRKVPGVVEASANWKEKTVALHLDRDSDVEPDLLREAVEDSNFTLGRQLQQRGDQ